MKKVFIVDDEPFITTVYKSRLEQEGYEVVCAHFAEDAMIVLETLRPALIMLDLNLPDTNGVELLRYIRSRPEIAHTPVVILSHGYVKKLVDEALELGIIRFFTKALTPPKIIIAEIKELLETPATQKSRLNGTGSRYSVFTDFTRSAACH